MVHYSTDRAARVLSQILFLFVKQMKRAAVLVGLVSLLVIALLAYSTWHIQLPSGAATTPR
jgi:hypothetical protein